MASNTEIEMRWIDAWSDVLELAGGRNATPCLLPDGRILEDVELCLGWIQQTVYRGSTIAVAGGWVGHRRGIVITFVDEL